MPCDPAGINRSRAELIRGAWRLPWIAAVLIMDHIALFPLKTPAPKRLKNILRLEPKRDFHEPSRAECERLARVWRLAGFILRRVFRTSRPCLRRCMLVLRCCRRWGVCCGLVIGVDLQSGGLKGHSWIEFQGQPFLEDPASLMGFKPVLTAHSKGGMTYHFKGQRDRDYAANSD